MPFLCGWDAMSELVFTFESSSSGRRGTIYLDDVYVERRGTGAPTPGPECTQPLPVPTPAHRVVADFDSCADVNNLGEKMGTASAPGCQMWVTYDKESERGCVAKLGYHIDKWSAFWIKLGELNLDQDSHLLFDIKADEPVPWEIKIELKRFCQSGECRQVSTYHLGGDGRLTTDWQTIDLPLESFGSPDWTPGLFSYWGLEELVFSFEYGPAGTDGVVYLDNVMFTP
jgi:hypothetical protein